MAISIEQGCSVVEARAAPVDLTGDGGQGAAVDAVDESCGAERIPGLEIVELDAAHAVNANDSAGWNAAVTDFLTRHRP